MSSLGFAVCVAPSTRRQSPLGVSSFAGSACPRASSPTVAARRRTCTMVAPVGGESPDLVLQAAMFAAGPVLNVFTLVMIIRIVLTWYPKTDLRKVPWIFLAVPTEPILAATRQVIKPVGGVDITPIVWVAVSTFVHEILMGPQGILVLLSQGK